MFYLFIFDYVSIQTGFEIYFYNYFYLLFLPGERERVKKRQRERENRWRSYNGIDYMFQMLNA